jgi:2-hydroxychromene-2-carboxylate isomerase
MGIVVFGSFNCPYSYLASRRVDRLAEHGFTDVIWRAVVHEPDVPAPGLPVTGDLGATFDRELEEIRGLLLRGEAFPARRPPVQPNTALAVAAYAEASGSGADRLRGALFDAFWVKGQDIGDPKVLEALGCPRVEGSAVADAWQQEWQGIERAIVPMLVLADSSISRGLGALRRLADPDLETLEAR